MNTSKLPSLDEISQMAGKLFSDVKSSVQQIYDEYKVKHPDICEVSTCSKEKVETKKKKQAGKADNEAGLPKE
jgi:hypothetical protein